MPLIPLPTFDATTYAAKVTNLLRVRGGQEPLAPAAPTVQTVALEAEPDVPTRSNTKAEISGWIRDHGFDEDLSQYNKAELLELVDELLDEG